MLADLATQRSTPVHRADAISRLGVSYAHEGSWRNPVKEMLGRRAFNFDPMSEAVLFETEEDAVKHVVELARNDAEKQLARGDGFFANRAVKARLWLARNWAAMRRKDVGILATHAILENARDEYAQVLTIGPRVTVRRLGDLIRLPAVIDVETPVWVLDTSRFPKGDIVLQEDRIVSWSFVDVMGHPEYDVMIRYRLADTVGSFAYDYAEPEGDELQSNRSDVTVFLSEAAARQKLAVFAHDARAALERVGPYALLLPPPKPSVNTLALPSPEVEIPRIEDAVVVPATTALEMPISASAAQTDDVPVSISPVEVAMSITASCHEVAGAAEVPLAAKVPPQSPQSGAVLDKFRKGVAGAAKRLSGFLRRLRRPGEDVNATPDPIALGEAPAAPPTAPLLRDFISTGLKIRRPADIPAETSITRRALELTK